MTGHSDNLGWLRGLVGLGRLVVAACWLLGASACATSQQEPGESNTNWLETCQRDADCGEGAACLCGMCTKTCEQSGECDGVGASAECLDTESLAMACGAALPDTRVCASPCGYEGACEGELMCEQDRCVAQGSGDPGDGGDGDGGDGEEGGVDGMDAGAGQGVGDGGAKPPQMGQPDAGGAGQRDGGRGQMMVGDTDSGEREVGDEARAVLSGTIVFEQAHDYGYVEHQGISTYSIDDDQLTLLVDGIYPRRHPTNGETVFLQQCADIPGDGVYYRVAIADDRGLATPISRCSVDIPNPTTGVFILDDMTEFGLVSLSPDASKISVTESYDVLSEDQSHVVGESLNTVIYDRDGERVAELPNAYDAAWLPSGRLLYVYGNQFFLTDADLGNPTAINDGSALSTGVNNPAVHPSGEYFVFEYNSQLWQMNIDGTGLSRLLAIDRRPRYPTWSPDGNKLLFTVWDTGNVSSALTSFFIIDFEADDSYRIDIGSHLMTLAEPWGPISWVR